MIQSKRTSEIPLPPSSNLSIHSLFSFGHSLQDHNSYLLLKTFAMKYSISAIVLGFFAALSAAAPTPDDKPEAGKVTITEVKFGGTGCPTPSSATIQNSPDWSTVTVIFNTYQATIGPGTGIADHIKNCNLNFKVNYPPGYQYTLYQNDYTGYIYLEDGVTATQTSSYWFAGFINSKPTFQSIWNKPINEQYTFTDALKSVIYSPCGASTTLNINTQLVLTSTNPKAQGLINTQTIETKTVSLPYKHKYAIRWQKC